MGQGTRLITSESDQVSEYIASLEHRYPGFIQKRKQYLREGGADRFSRFYVDYIALGGRQNFEEGLMGILTEKEQNLLHSDPVFTKAWRAFVNLRWTQKQISRAVFAFIGIVVVPLLVYLLGWTFFESVRSATGGK